MGELEIQIEEAAAMLNITLLAAQRFASWGRIPFMIPRPHPDDPYEFEEGLREWADERARKRAEYRRAHWLGKHIPPTTDRAHALNRELVWEWGRTGRVRMINARDWLLGVGIRYHVEDCRREYQAWWAENHPGQCVRCTMIAQLDHNLLCFLCQYHQETGKEMVRGPRVIRPVAVVNGHTKNRETRKMFSSFG